MKFAFGLFFGLLVGCATSIGQGVLRFQDREFIPHPDKPAMSFPYYKQVCVSRTGLGKVFGKKCHQERVEDNYDFNDKAVRQKFIDASCSMKCAGRFQY